MAQAKSLRLISSLRERAPVPALSKVSFYLVDHCCYAWNTLIDQPSTAAKILEVFEDRI
jgi:hypothetical protein